MGVRHGQRENLMTTSSIAALYSPLVLIALIMFPLATPTAAMAAEPVLRIVPHASIVDTDSSPSAQAVDAPTRVAEAASEKRAARPHHLIILFHGIGGRGSVMEALGNSWEATLPDTVFVAPNAPFSHKSGARQWFAVNDQVMRPDRLQAARRAFDDLVSDIVQREGFKDALDRVAFIGVSQGAIMALDAVASGRWKVGALVSFAGLLPMPPTSSSTDTRILLMHGGADRTIPSAASVAANGQLQSAGYDVTLKTFPDIGHTISSEQAKEAALFLRERFK
jgi:phospholipase/carboxylesterase